MYSLSNFKRHILFQINLCKQKFISVYPFEKVRKKRGLINALGSVIKFISGNLDQEDAKRYDKAIENLQSNQDKIINSFNKQISLNIQLLDNYNKTLELIQHNQDIILDRINEIQQKINKLEFEFSHYQKVRDVFDQVSDNLNSVILFLTDLENAITFSKLRTLHRSVLNFEELKATINKLQELYHSDQLMFNNEIDFYNYYDLIDVRSYYSGYRLVFILSVPIVNPYPFKYYHLFSVPTINLTTIIPKKPYLANHKDLYQYQDLPCQHLNPSYYCPELQIQNLDEQEDCVTSILNLGNKVNCHLTQITLKANIIEKLNDMHYLLVMPQEQKVSINCKKIDFVNLKGAYLITLPHGCSLEIGNNTKIANDKGSTEHQPLLLSEVKIHEIKQNSSFSKLKLQNIPLDQLQVLKNQQKELTIEKTSSHYTSQNFWTIPVYVLILIGLFLILYKRIKKHCRSRSKGNADPGKDETMEMESVNQPSVLFTPKTSS